jgi:hypothetical protein
MVSELRRGAAAGGTWAIYILVSTPPMDLSPADFIFHQSLSRRLSTSMQCIGDQEPTENQLRRTGGIPIKGQGAQAAACSIYFTWPQSTLNCTPQPSATRMPTPHPTRHRMRGLPPSRLRTPGSPRDRGASLTLSSSIPARIPRSFTGLTTYAAVWPLVRALRRLSVSSWASWPAAPRQHACPMVRASLPPPSMQPQDHSWPLFRTSPHT